MVQEEILIIWFLESEIGLAANLADPKDTQRFATEEIATANY